MTNHMQGSARFLGAHRLLFPVAVAFAVVMVPLWLAQYLQGLPLGAAAPTWHGHELLFGSAPAVGGGYLITRGSPAAPVALVVCWLAGRAALLRAGPPALPHPIRPPGHAGHDPRPAGGPHLAHESPRGSVPPRE